MDIKNKELNYMKKQTEVKLEVKEISEKKEVKRSSEISCAFCGYIQPTSFTKCLSCNNELK